MTQKLHTNHDTFNFTRAAHCTLVQCRATSEIRFSDGSNSPGTTLMEGLDGAPSSSRPLRGKWKKSTFSGSIGRVFNEEGPRECSEATKFFVRPREIRILIGHRNAEDRWTRRSLNRESLKLPADSFED